MEKPVSIHTTLPTIKQPRKLFAFLAGLFIASLVVSPLGVVLDASAETTTAAVAAATTPASVNDAAYDRTLYEITNLQTKVMSYAVVAPGIAFAQNSTQKAIAKVASTKKGSLVPVYEVTNPKNGNIIFTRLAGEKDKAIKELGWKDRGVKFYADAAARTGVHKVYRFHNSAYKFRVAQTTADQSALIGSGYTRDSSSSFYAPTANGQPVTSIPESKPLPSTPPSMPAPTPNKPKVTPKTDGLVSSRRCYDKSYTDYLNGGSMPSRTPTAPRCVTVHKVTKAKASQLKAHNTALIAKYKKAKAAWRTWKAKHPSNSRRSGGDDGPQPVSQDCTGKPYTWNDGTCHSSTQPCPSGQFRNIRNKCQDNIVGKTSCRMDYFGHISGTNCSRGRSLNGFFSW